jgi:DNA-binding SARP family transcriptional activator
MPFTLPDCDNLFPLAAIFYVFNYHLVVRTAMLEIRCFQRLQITIAYEHLHDLDRSPVLRRLLSYFILRRGQVLDRSQVAGLFWPDVPEAKARRALNTQLWRLRRLAGGTLASNLETTRHTVQWTPPAGAWLDIHDFELLTSALADMRQRPVVTDGAILAALEQAVKLHRGPLLADLDAEWCLLPRYRFQERYLQALKTLITGFERCRLPDRALQYATQLVQAEPYHEMGHEALIRLHLEQNQPQAALKAYHHYVQLWQDDLALPPSDQVRQLIPASERASNLPDTHNMLALISTQLTQMATRSDASATLRQATRQATYNLCRSLAHKAESIGKTADDEYAWDIAGQAYEMALVALEMLPADSESLQRQMNLRLHCDTIYDRLARRHMQTENLLRALNLAQRMADKGLQSEIHARQCWLAMKEGDLQAAIQWGHRALTLSRKDRRLQAQALRLLGTGHELMGAYANALAYHQKALVLDADQAEWLRLDHNNLASVYTSLGQDWQALTHIRSALALTPAQPPSLVQVIALDNLSNIERELGDFAKAMSHLKEAQEMASMLGDLSVEARLAVRASVLYRQTKDFNRAQFWATQAWRQSSNSHSLRYRIESALELARLTYLEGEFKPTKQWIQRADDLVLSGAYARYRGMVALLRGMFCLHTNSLHGAAQTATNALAAVQTGNECRYLAPCYALLGLILSRQGNESSARRQLEKAQAALRERVHQIPDQEARGRFLKATRFRSRLFHRQQLPELIDLWLA